MNKRTLLIIGFILAVIAFAAIIYFVFIKDLVSPSGNTNNTNTTTNQNGNTNLPGTNVLPTTNQSGTNRNTNQAATNTVLNVNGTTNTNTPSTIANGGATEAKATININAVGAMLAADGQMLYYDKVSQKFYRLDSKGQLIALSDQLFPDVSQIAWSPSGDKAVITFPDNSKIVYDFNKKTQVTLPKEWDNIEFSSTGTKLGFKNMTNDTTSRWLAVANTDGSEIQAIEPMGDNADGVAVNWSPDGQVLATFRQGISAEAQEVLLIGLNGENFKALATDGRGFEGKWSPTGDQLLYDVYNSSTLYNPNLYLVDAKGDTIGANKMDIGLKTWVSKCTFAKSTKYVYCAVPDSLPEGSGLIPQLATNTQDTIYKINTNTGAKGIVALPTNLARDRYDVAAMFLSADEGSLYFQDAKTGKVYTIQLK